MPTRKNSLLKLQRGNANPVDFESAFGTLCYPKCTTCQKAKKWLDDNKIQYELRDIKLDNPTLLELKNKLANMTEEEMLKLLATEIKSAKPLKQASKSGWQTPSKYHEKLEKHRLLR